MKWLSVVLSVSVWAAPVCSTGTPACTEKFPVGAEGRFVTVYRSQPLTNSNQLFTRALVVVHGASRNADDYFRSGVAGAFLAEGLENTLVVAPRFAGSGTSKTCADPLEPGEIAFACSGENWRSGGRALDEPSVTSYDVMDRLVRHFADKKRFPNLRNVVLFGHSAGGQFMSRYAAAAAPEPDGVAIEYVVSNPSSYLYLDAVRPGPTEACPKFDAWPYGMLDRTGAGARLDDSALRQNLLRRNVVYLLGEYDTTPQFGFDGSCGGMAQGPSRLERGISYHGYMTKKFGASHRLVKVPNCGHNGRCMLVANEARGVLFP